MSDFFNDDFTAELKKYFLESFIKEVDKYLDLVDEKLWKRLGKEIQETCQTWMIDAKTNEFLFLSAWLERTSKNLHEVESQEEVLSYLKILKAYLAEILAGTKDSEDLQKKYVINRFSQKTNLLLHCQVGSQDFAIPVLSVVEITSDLRLFATPLPQVGIAGVAAFRGDPLPVIALKDFGFPEVNQQSGIYVVCEWKQIRFALKVDRAEDFMNVAEKDFQDLDAKWVPETSSAQKFFTQNNKNIIYLNMDSLVAA